MSYKVIKFYAIFAIVGGIFFCMGENLLRSVECKNCSYLTPILISPHAHTLYSRYLYLAYYNPQIQHTYHKHRYTALNY